MVERLKNIVCFCLSSKMTDETLAQKLFIQKDGKKFAYVDDISEKIKELKDSFRKEVRNIPPEFNKEKMLNQVDIIMWSLIDKIFGDALTNSPDDLSRKSDDPDKRNIHRTKPGDNSKRNTSEPSGLYGNKSCTKSKGCGKVIETIENGIDGTIEVVCGRDYYGIHFGGEWLNKRLALCSKCKGSDNQNCTNQKGKSK